MSLSTFAANVTTSEVAPVKKPTTPKPYAVFQILEGRFKAEGKSELDARKMAQEEAIEGYFGAIESVTDLKGLLLGLGVMVAEAPKNEKGYIAGLNAFRRPYKAMFSMALNAALPDSEDFGLLLTWADVLHGSDPALRAIVDDVRTRVNADETEEVAYRDQLVRAKATYKASKA